MKIPRGGLNIVASVMLIAQMLVPGVILASDPEVDSTVSPTPLVVASPTPSGTPDESVSPTTTSTPEGSSTPTPSDTATPTPSESITPLLVQSPTPTDSTTSTPPTPTETEATSTRGAEQVCHGNPPDWVFDNDIHKWVEADVASFACDKPSGYFLSPKYYFDTRTGWYRTMPASGIAPAGTLTSPQVIHTILGDVVVGSPDYRTAVALGIITPSGQAVSAANTGSGSTNDGTINNTNQAWFDMTSLVNVINVLQSTANSGGVAAQDNTKVGDVSTGTANVVANLINLLASAWSWSHGNLNFFMQNLFGNQVGDITLQPNSATTGGGGLGDQSISNSQTGSGSTNDGTINNTTSLDVNAKSTGNITNNVDLAAGSGSANVADNTIVGNVSTGDATAQANIINLINSFINSGDSFFAILNIFGNLNGDILFPDGFLNGLLGTTPTAGTNAVSASGTGPDSTNQATINNTQATNLTGSSTQNFNNNINTTAQSGSANVADNTGTGNISSGAATTSGSLFNIANSSIFGDNAVLVMVNVMGHWMGRLMSIPGGTSQTALLTGNATVTQNDTGPDSTNTGTINNTRTADINLASEGTITNNVNVAAQSGYANVTDNTKVGDIATGTAKATSSVANLMNTALNIKHWFGVLIINVFGEWTGSVNENTSAGNAPVAASQSTQHQSPAAAALSKALKTFSAPLAKSGTLNSAAVVPAAVTSVATGGATGQVLTAAAHVPATVATVASHNTDMTWLFIVSAVLLLLAGAASQIEHKLRKN